MIKTLACSAGPGDDYLSSFVVAVLAMVPLVFLASTGVVDAHTEAFRLKAAQSRNRKAIIWSAAGLCMAILAAVILTRQILGLREGWLELAQGLPSLRYSLGLVAVHMVVYACCVIYRGATRNGEGCVEDHRVARVFARSMLVLSLVTFTAASALIWFQEPALHLRMLLMTSLVLIFLLFLVLEREVTYEDLRAVAGLPTRKKQASASGNLADGEKGPMHDAAATRELSEAEAAQWGKYLKKERLKKGFYQVYLPWALAMVCSFALGRGISIWQDHSMTARSEMASLELKAGDRTEAIGDDGEQHEWTTVAHFGELKE